MRLSFAFARLSIRHKLLALALLPLLGVLPLLGAGLLWWGNEALDAMLRTKVRADLAVARGYFERTLAEVGASTRTVAESQALALTLQDSAVEGPGAVQGLLQRFAERERLDFIRLAGTDEGLEVATSVEVLDAAAQDILGAALRTRVAVPLLPTRNAAPTTSAVEDRAMVLLATRAVHDARGRLLGHVQAGVLLNRNLPFIDHINEIVYPEGSLPMADWGSKGTATLFLDDVRISTNVRLFGAAGQERAIGTRVSRSVRDAVLGRGSLWLDRAFVVDDWYVSGYQPLSDGAGRRVGMLYVGVLERPFTLLKYGVLAGIGGLFLAVMVVAAMVSLRWARAIFAPLERMEAVMRRAEAGALDARTGALTANGSDTGSDEIGRLARHLDRLLQAVDEHTRELDARVAERTHALQEAQRQLVRSERLATVGQLTASIAHEVNNPIAVIQGNLDLLRELLGPEAAARVEPELRLVDQQIERMRLIVTQLLQFARPTEFAGYVERLDTSQIVEDCLVLVKHLLAGTQITVTRELRATRCVHIHRQELQQVLVNLLVNAIHAMGGGDRGGDRGGQGSGDVSGDVSGDGIGGRLLLRTQDAGDDAVEIIVADSGPGVPTALLGQLFQPFVTRKPDGTGLGLWISRGIVERYGGDISAGNRPDGGAVFTVRLTTEQP